MVPAPAFVAIAGDILWCLGLGLLLAMARDVLGWVLGNGRVLGFLWDMTAFAGAAVALYGFAAGASATGTVRWYMALGMLAGALGWQCSAGVVLRAVGRAVLTLLLRPWQWFCRCVAIPCAQKARKAMESRIALHRKMQKIHEKKAKSGKKQLQNQARVLYN